MLGLGEGAATLLALGADGDEALAGDAQILVEPHRLFVHLTDLHAHLLAPLKEPLEFALHLLHVLAQIAQAMLAHLNRFALGGFARREAGHARAQHLLVVPQAVDLGLEPLGLGPERGPVRGEQGLCELALLVLQGLVLLRFLRLPLQGVQLPLHLVHHVAHAREVLAGGRQLPLGLVALLLVPRDSRRFLDERPALVGLGRQDVVELVLVHDGVRTRVGAGAREEVEDVAQAGDAVVEQILAVARAVETAADRDLAPRHRQRAFVGERQADFRETDRLARGRAVEDQVFHALTAQRLGALLAECPTDGF
jgi:hypothetical protein